MTDSWVDSLEALATSVTSVLGPEATDLTHTVFGALNDVWARFLGSPGEQGRVNWQAYTHKQLHAMLWHEADVGEVSAIADEWGRHSTELAGHADALRTQQGELRANWHGAAAELAADRLGKLRDRVSRIAARAGEVHKAAQNSADALATARRTMPPPPPDPVELSGTPMTAALGSVSTGGASMYFTSTAAMDGKATAVQVMRGYETGLLGSGELITPAPPGSTKAATYHVDGETGTTSAAGVHGGAAAPRAGGVPWHQLVGDRIVAPGVERTVPPVAGSVAAESAAAQRGLLGGVPPGSARSGGAQDKDRAQRLPTVDQGLFAVDERPSLSVIGL